MSPASTIRWWYSRDGNAGRIGVDEQLVQQTLETEHSRRVPGREREASPPSQVNCVQIGVTNLLLHEIRERVRSSKSTRKLVKSTVGSPPSQGLAGESGNRIVHFFRESRSMWGCDVAMTLRYYSAHHRRQRQRANLRLGRLQTSVDSRSSRVKEHSCNFLPPRISVFSATT